jgi:hypothetical protein
MRHLHVAPLLALAACLGCVDESQPDLPLSAVEDDAELRTSNEVDYVLEIGEMKVFRAVLPDHEPPYTLAEPGYTVFGNGEDVALIARAPGRYTLSLRAPGSGELRDLTIEVEDRAFDLARDRSNLVFDDLGVGQPIVFSSGSIRAVQVADAGHTRVEVSPSGRSIEVTPARPGPSDVLLWSSKGVKRVVIDALPVGQLPRDAETHDLTLGASRHQLDMTGVVRVTIHDPGVARVTQVTDKLAVVEPVGAGLTPISFFPKEGAPRTIWYRVQSAE